MSKETLNKQQELFAKEYIKDLNAKQAAIRAGYSAKTAESKGSQLLRIVKVSTYIQKLMKKREERTEVTSDNVLKELAKIAFMQEADFYNEDGTPKLAKDLTDAQRSALKSYSVKSVSVGDGVYEEIPIFTAHDKVKTLELLAKHLGMFIEKQEVSHVGHITMLPRKDEEN